MNLISDNLYDEPLTNLTYPYVVLGDGFENPDNTLCYNGFDVIIFFKIYVKSGSLGYYNAKQIIKAMNDVLNMKKFAMDGYDMIICKYDGSSVVRDDDIRSINVRYNVLADTNTAIAFN
jgi:hypothetical protein